MIFHILHSFVRPIAIFTSRTISTKKEPLFAHDNRLVVADETTVLTVTLHRGAAPRSTARSLRGVPAITDATLSKGRDVGPDMKRTFTRARMEQRRRVMSCHVRVYSRLGVSQSCCSRGGGRGCQLCAHNCNITFYRNIRSLL